MATAPDPYVNTQPGDLITAQLFNGLQSTIKEDIAAQIKKAIDELKTVDNAGDSAKLGGKTPKDLEEEIIKRALLELPRRTGYRMLFKILLKGEEKIVEHNLAACPLVDLYQLDYFRVVCARGEGSAQQKASFVNFYLYHSSETSLSDPSSAPGPDIEIEPTDVNHHAFTIDFERLLELYEVPYTAKSNLRELETEFWKKFFDVNDRFARSQYCHSPWFEDCCGQKRTVGALQDGGDWNDIQFQLRPRKFAHFPKTPEDSPVLNHGTATKLATVQADIEVVHFNLNTLGLRLLGMGDYPDGVGKANELKVMLLLKV